MRKGFSVIMIMAVCIVFALSSAVLANDPTKEWEYNLAVGYMNFKENSIDDPAYVSLRAMKRIGYPFLAGMSASGALIGDVAYVEAGIPIVMRVDTGISDIKADVLAMPGVGYARNSDTKLSKVVGAATGGLEVRKFIRGNGNRAISVGVGAYYTIHTYSKLNNFKLALVIGF